MYILVVDDGPIVYRTWHRVLRSTPFGILDATTYQEAEALLENRGNDIRAIILDVWLEPGCGLDLVPLIRKCCPGARVLVFSAFLDADIATRAQELNLRILPKEGAAPVLRRALRLLTPDDDRSDIGDLRSLFPELTDRQLEVIKTSLDHDTDQKAADALGITRKTYETHWSNIMKRTGLSRRQIINRVIAWLAKKRTSAE
jgi:DNA-binding NarL/FixJ family response regulator